MSSDDIENNEGGENFDDKSDDGRLAKFLLDLSNDANVMDEQRDAANEDMRFVNVVGGMWEGFLINDFTDTRVKMEFDLVSNSLERFKGEWDQNRVGVEFKPDDGATNDDDAELLNGIYRADFRNFSGQTATDAAVDECATCGYGAMKLATLFEDDDDAENDNQRIAWRPIYNAYNTVFWDDGAQRIDKRDAQRCTELTAFTKDKFREAFDDKDPVSAFNPNNLNLQIRIQDIPDFVYVATRYDVVTKDEKMFVYNNLQSGLVEVYNEEDHELIKDELRADDLRTFVRERKIKRQRIEKTVFSGAEFLEDTKRIAGKWIPIIPVYGYRAYVDGSEWYRGLVRKLKDPARLYNMQISQLAEDAASSGQEVPIFNVDQMLNPDIQAKWANKNNEPYLLVEPSYDQDGKVQALGPVGTYTPGQLNPSQAAIMQLAPEHIQNVTGGVPQETLDPDMSGKAIQALVKRENLTTRIITRNIANAIMWSGEVYQAMAAEVYTTRRIIRTIGKDGKESPTQLLKTVLDSETGRPVESNSLRGKKFRAYADAGPAYDTLREQTVEDLKGMLEALQGIEGGERYTSALIAVLLENITGVGLDPIKELNRRIMLVEGLVKPETDEEEAMVAQARQPKEDPQRKLIEAAAEQQLAEAGNLQSASIEKISSAKLKNAQTIETLSKVDIEQQKIDLATEKAFAEQQKQIIDLATRLPINQ